MVVGDIIKRAARRYPGKVALIFENVRYTFDEFNSRVNSLSQALLGMGLMKGDRIAVLMDTCPQFLELYFGAAKAGVILVPLSCRLSQSELAYIINNAKANTLFVGASYRGMIDSIRDELETVKNLIIVEAEGGDLSGYEGLVSGYSGKEPEVEVHESDLAYLAYTSGTTGLPKGAMLTHRCLLEMSLNYVLLPRLSRDDVDLAMVPVEHLIEQTS